jgi:hypothetical protein
MAWYLARSAGWGILSQTKEKRLPSESLCSGMHINQSWFYPMGCQDSTIVGFVMEKMNGNRAVMLARSSGGEIGGSG